MDRVNESRKFLPRGRVTGLLTAIVLLHCSGCQSATALSSQVLRTKIIPVQEDELYYIPSSTNGFACQTGQTFSVKGSYSGSSSVLETGGIMHFGSPSVTTISLTNNQLYRRTFGFMSRPIFPDGTLVEITGIMNGGGRFVYPIAEIYGITLSAQGILDLTNEQNEAKATIEKQLKEAADYDSGLSSIDICKKQHAVRTKSIPVNMGAFSKQPLQFYSADLPNKRLVYTVRGPNVGLGPESERVQRHLYLYVVYDFVAHRIDKALITIVTDYIWLE